MDSYMDDYSEILKALSYALNEIHGLKKSEQFWDIILYRDISRYITFSTITFNDKKTGNTFKQDYAKKKMLGFFKIMKEIFMSYRKRSTIVLFPDHNIPFLKKILTKKDVYPLIYQYEYEGIKDRPGYNSRIQARRDVLFELLHQILPRHKSQHIASTIDEKILFHFKTIYRYIRWQYRLINNIKCSIGGFYPTVEQRILLATLKENSLKHNIKTITSQHGGCYGERKLLFNLFECSERGFSSIFSTWGWKDDDTCIKLPATRLLKVRDNYAGNSAEKKKLLFVLSVNFDNTLEVNKNQHRINLLNSISNEIFRSTIIRTRKNKGHNNDLSFLEKIRIKDHARNFFEEIEVDFQKEDIVRLYEKAHLVVLETLFTTSFLECLALDIPVIISLSEPIEYDHVRNPELILRLVEQGIIYTSVNQASDMINSNLSSIHKWWNNPERRSVINAYREMYAYIGESPEKEWEEFFNRIIP